MKLVIPALTGRGSSPGVSQGIRSRQKKGQVGDLSYSRSKKFLRLDDAQELLDHLILRGDDAGRGLIAALEADQVGELGGHVHV